MDGCSAMQLSICPRSCQITKVGLPQQECQEANLIESIAALRTSSVAALLPFPRAQQAKSEHAASSKPCSPPDSPAHSATGSPFLRSAKGKGRSFNTSIPEAELSSCTDAEVQSDADEKTQPSHARQLRGSCASSCILLLPSTSVTSPQPPSGSYSSARMQTCLQLLDHAVSADAEPRPSAPADSTAPHEQPSTTPRSSAVQRTSHSSSSAEALTGQCSGDVSEEEGVGTPSLWADVPDDVLRAVCAHMPPSYVRVVRLVCRGWAAAAGRSMQRLKPEALEGPRLTERFPHLRALDLSHCLHTVTFQTQTALQLRSNVTDELVGQLAPLRNLRELSLRGCTGLTGSPKSGFTRITALTRLECLDISNCKALQDDALKVVAQLSGLRQLRAVGCASLTDAALQHLAGLQGLLQLDLGCNARITDNGISALAGMRGLELVNLVSLAQITNTGVASLAALPKLKRITVSRCAHICEGGLQEHFVGKQLRLSMCGTPLRRSMCAWMSSVLADLDNLLFER
ncbi:probable f-box/LRR-repeat protein 2 at C-terminar half [Coccomyxa sp. Obi]|nr:probable f-box/LRR-repeat protein 2 at C-terminar half [Coccomyxa sp. Obi]